MKEKKQKCSNCGKTGYWTKYRGEGKSVKELSEDSDLCNKCYWDE